MWCDLNNTDVSMSLFLSLFSKELQQCFSFCFSPLVSSQSFLSDFQGLLSLLDTSSLEQLKDSLFVWCLSDNFRDHLSDELDSLPKNGLSVWWSYSFCLFFTLFDGCGDVASVQSNWDVLLGQLYHWSKIIIIYSIFINL